MSAVVTRTGYLRLVDFVESRVSEDMDALKADLSANYPCPAPWWARRLMGQYLVLQRVVADYYEAACDPHLQAQMYWLLRYESYVWSDHPDYDQSWSVSE